MSSQVISNASVSTNVVYNYCTRCTSFLYSPSHGRYKTTLPNQRTYL